MKMRINTYDFIKAVKILERVNNNVLPILDSVYISVKDGNIRLSRTDLEKTVNIYFPADIEFFSTIILPIKTINMLKNLKDDYFELTENEIITEKKTISFKRLNNEEYPELDISKTNEFFFELTESELNKMLEVKYCMSSEKDRPILRGVCFDENKTIAIDGYRLSLRKGDYKSDIHKIIIGSDIINLLDKVLDKKSDDIVKVYGKEFGNKNTQYIKFEFNRRDFLIEVIGKTIQGEYFNYKTIIPEYFDTTIEVNSDDVLSEMEFMVKVSNKERADIITLIKDEYKLILNGKITEMTYDKEASITETRKRRDEANSEYYKEMEEYNKKKANGKRAKKPKQKTIKEVKIYKPEETNRIKSKIEAITYGNDWEANFNMKFIYEVFKQYNDTNLKIKANTDISPIIITVDDENVEMVLPIRIR